MKKLSKEHIIMLHDMLVRHTGGASGLRDNGLLESAIGTPFATFDGADLYPTIFFIETKKTNNKHYAYLIFG